MKINVRLLLLLFVVNASVLAQTVSVAKPQLNKDMWIANAKYNIDSSGQYELVAVAAGLHAAFIGDPNLTAQQGLSIVHTALTNLSSWKGTSAGTNASPGDIYQETLSLVADATSSASVKAAANIGKDLLAFAPSSPPEDNWKSLNAFQAAEFSLDRQRESAVLQSAYDDAQSSTAFRTALDQGIGTQLKGLTSDSASTLLDHNPGLSTALGVSNLTTALAQNGQTVQLSIASLQTSIDNHFNDLTSVTKENGALLATINQEQADIRGYLADAAAQQRVERAAQQQQKLDSLRLEAADAAFQVFGTILGGATGEKVAETGHVAIKVAGSISDFVNNTSKLSTGLGAAVLTGNLLGAAVDLAGIFGGGPSVSQQLAEISQQLNSMQNEMDKRFDRIDGELTQIYDQVNKDFQQEMQILQGINVQLDQVREDLYSMSQQLNGVENKVLEAIKNLDSQRFVTEYSEYYQYFQQKRAPMAQTEFDGAEGSYVAAIVLGNASPQIDTDQPPDIGTGVLATKLRGSVDAPKFAALPPEEINIVLSSAGIAPADGPLVNPQLWMLASSAYLDLANQPMTMTGHGSSQRRKTSFICKASKATTFINSGNRIKTSLTSISLTTDATPSDIKNPVFRREADSYSDALKSFTSEMDGRRASIVKTLGYDPWQPIAQSTSAVASLGATPVTECGAGGRTIGGAVSLSGIAAAGQLFANASHFTQKDAGLTMCMDGISYSTHTSKVEHFPEPYPGFAIDHGFVPRFTVHTLSISGTAHLMYRQIEITKCAFTTPQFSWVDRTQFAANPPDAFSETVANWSSPSNPTYPVISAIVQACSFLAANPPATTAATNDLQTLFASSRKDLVTTAWITPLTQIEQRTADPQLSLTKLSDYKAELWALVQLGMPSAFESDEILRSNLAEQDSGLIDRVAVIKKLSSLIGNGSEDDLSKFDIGAYEKDAQQKTANFRALLAKRLEIVSQAGGDIPVGISGGIAGLNKLNGAYSACQPH